MRIRTLLATSTATLGLAATSVLAGPAQASPPVPDSQAGHLVSWGTASSTAATDLDRPAVAAKLDGKRIVGVSTAVSAVTAAVTDQGELLTWGNPHDAAAQGPASDLSDVTTIAVDSGTGLALEDNGTVVGWGIPSNDDAATALDGQTAKAIAADAGYAYAVTATGTLKAWGTSPFALYGLSGPPASLSEDGADLTDVVAGTLVGATLDESGHMTTWPDSPEVLPGLGVDPAIQGHIVKIAAGGQTFGAILDDGSVRVWGNDTVFNDSIPDVPEKPDGHDAVSLAVNGSHAFVVTDDGVVHAYGPDDDLTGASAIAAIAGINHGQHAVSVSSNGGQVAVIVTDFRALSTPTISGTPTVGQTLSAAPATFSLDPDAPATGQWLANGQPISGATGTTLKLGSAFVGKKISYEATATRDGDTVTSTSMTVGPVAKATSRLHVAKVKVKGKKKAKKRTAVVKATVRTSTGVPATGKVKVTIKGKVKRKHHKGKRTVTRHKTVKLNRKGIAKAKVKGLKHGKYKVTVRYPGSSSVTASHGKKKFKV